MRESPPALCSKFDCGSSHSIIGAPGWTRTSSPRLRTLVLYSIREAAAASLCSLIASAMRPILLDPPVRCPRSLAFVWRPQRGSGRSGLAKCPAKWKLRRTHSRRRGHSGGMAGSTSGNPGTAVARRRVPLALAFFDPVDRAVTPEVNRDDRLCLGRIKADG